MKLLALWAPLADYSVAALKHLTLNYDVELMIVYQANESNAPYKSLNLNFCANFMVWDNHNKKNIINDCLNFNPDVILMSSWNYKYYMEIAKKCKKKSTCVISTFDGQWMGTLKQYLGIIISSFYLKPVIDNFFVSGDRQSIFARKLGYKNPMQGYYSANTTNLVSDITTIKDNKFIFVGRLVEVKNIETLVNAYMAYRKNVSKPWDLIICGKGPLESLCVGKEGITLMNFTQPSDLQSIMQSSRCLILPSLFEPWGLVIHEAALAGLAIICSYHVGASTAFVRDWQNGFIINTDIQSLIRAMTLLTEISEEKLLSMAKISKTLGDLWTTEKWAEYVYNRICLPNVIKMRY